jgi:signal transduction histidine kinase
MVKMDSGLAEIMIINLLKNAIIHNNDGGEITVEVSRRSFRIENSGEKTPLNRERLFDRFYRGSDKKENFGLGLALVKKICEYYGFDIAYEYQNEKHSFNVQFR